jgi:hypothetical protein
MESMDRASMDKVVSDHFMYEASDDVEGVLKTFTDDVEHEVVGGADGPMRGKAQLRRFYERLFAEVAGESMEPVWRLYGDNFLIDETIWVGRLVDGRTFGFAGKSGKVRLRLLHVFNLKDGLIIKENVWFNSAELKRQLT